MALSGTLSGSAIVSIFINTPSVNFGAVPMDQSTTQTMTFINSGLSAASQFAINAGSLSSPFALVSTSCGPTLGGGNSSCNATVSFSPSSPGAYQGVLSGTYNTGVGQGSFSATLSGTSTVPPLVAVNGNHSCARTYLGQLKCWGENNYGQLGLGDFVNRGSVTGSMGSNLSSVALPTGRYPIFIALGYWHTCVILDDNSIRCWGNNNYGQLGLGTGQSTVGGAASDMGDNLAAVDLGAGFTPVSLSLGYAHSCAMSNQGAVKCWGENQEGQLGLGDTATRGLQTSDMGTNLAAVYLGGHKAVQISAATSNTCAILDNQTLKCWGNNFYGQLGLGDIINRGDTANSMTALPSIDLGTGEVPVTVSAGGAFTCVLLQSGNVKCWGRNQSGILGCNWCQDSDGNTGLCSDAAFSVALPGYGIGPNQMGDALPYVDLGTGVSATGLVSSNSSICATLQDGGLKCWGDNTYGQLGQGDTVDRGLVDGSMGDALAAVSLGTGLTINAVTSGNLHSCVLFTNSQFKCWGGNQFGELGLGDSNNRGDEPGEMGDNLAFTVID